MSEAPNPPERKVRNPAGSGLHAARERITGVSEVDPSELLSMDPDIVVCKEDKLTGELSFEGLLRVDGTVSGKLIARSQASIIVGNSGIIEANILNTLALYVQGKVVGNVGNVDAVTLKSTARIHGDISCKTLEIEPGAVIVGAINVTCGGPVDGIDAGGRITAHVGAAPSSHVREIKATTRVSSILLLLEPQFDFHNSDGACPVSGAEEDSEAFAELITDRIEDIDSVIVIMDTHQRPHIAHSSFWTNHDGTQSPPLYTTITADDVKEGRWEPKDKELLKSTVTYLHTLAELKRYSLQIKPEHCLNESRGHAVVPWIDDALQMWSHARQKSPVYLHKCLNNNLDSTSFLAADVRNTEDPSSFLDPAQLKALKDADKVLVCGLSNATSTHESLKDLVDEWGVANLHKLCIIKRGYITEGEDFWSQMYKNKDLTIRRPAEAFLT